MVDILYLVAIIAALCGIFSYLSFYYKSNIFGKMLWRVETTNKLVALTFDDGPNPPYTEQIASILERYSGKSTFFVVGKNCLKYPEVVSSLHNGGHEIGVHSYSHKFSKYITEPTFNAEISRTIDILGDLSIKPKLFRFPWLYRNPWVMRSVERNRLLPVSGQFAHMFEPAQCEPTKIIKRLKKIIKPGSIIIFHDGYDAKGANRSQTVDAVAQICSNLHARGYRFVTVSELLSLSSKDG